MDKIQESKKQGSNIHLLFTEEMGPRLFADALSNSENGYYELVRYASARNTDNIKLTTHCAALTSYRIKI